MGRRYGGMRAEERARDQRERILRVGFDLISWYGFEGMRVEDVCELAGVPLSALYRLVGKKHDVGVSVVQHCVDGAVSAVLAEVDAYRGDRSVSAALAVATYVRHVTGVEGLFAVLHEESQRITWPGGDAEPLAVVLGQLLGDEPGSDLVAAGVAGAVKGLLREWSRGRITSEQALNAALVVCRAALGAAKTPQQLRKGVVMRN